MKKIIFCVILCLLLPLQASKHLPQQPAAIDFVGFLEISEEVKAHRSEHLVDLDTFLKMSEDEDTIILDTRSLNMFKQRHISGAIHLNFSDFTQEKLAKIIPNKNTRILIYCNNNFSDDPNSFALKRMPLALNIPTYINLYGYDYKNVYELNESVSVKDQRIKFLGSYDKVNTTHSNDKVNTTHSNDKVNTTQPATLESLIFVPDWTLPVL